MNKKKERVEWQGELPPEACQRRETFARHGHAMYHAQCVERQIAVLLATSCNRRFIALSDEEKENAFNQFFEKTMGALIRTIKTKVKVSPALDLRLARALQLRNWLSHNYFWERAGSLLTWDGREEMISELTEAAEELDAVDKELTGITIKWLKANGVTESMLQEEMQKYLEGKNA